MDADTCLVLLVRLIAPVLALLAPCASAQAAPIPTLDGIPGPCDVSTSGTAYACDPASYPCARRTMSCDVIRRGATDISLSLGGEQRHAGRGIIAIGSSEPLQPGETVQLRWKRPSSGAVLAVQARGARRARTVVLALRWRPTWVRVTANADGSLLVESARRSGTIPPEVEEPVTWAPRSAKIAAHRILGALTLRRDVVTSLRTVCAALAPGVAELFLRDAASDEYDVDPCVVALYFHVVGGENDPPVDAMTHAATRVRVRGNRAIVSSRLTFRYRQGRESSRPKPRTVTARALLVRDPDGVWSLATVTPLLGQYALADGRPWTDRQLERGYRSEARHGWAEAAARVHEQAVFDAASVDATAPEPCSPPMRSDPAGDVTVFGGFAPARRPLEHLDADLVETGRTADCLAIRTAGPLAARFTVLTSLLDIVVRDGRVLVTTREGEGTNRLPVAGVVAHLEPSRLVVRLPAKVSPGDGFILRVGPEGASYDDHDELPNSLNGRSARQ